MGINLPTPPNHIPRKGWSTEEKARLILDFINEEVKPHKPWVYDELRVTDSSQLLLGLLAGAAFVSGSVSGGWLREFLREYSVTGGGMDHQRLLENCVRHWQKTEPKPCWAIERNFKHPDAKSDDWRYWSHPEFIGNEFDPDWNEAIKFFDRKSADKTISECPDDWNVRIVEHQILGSRIL